MSEINKDPLAWEEICREHIVKDEWIDFRRLKYRFPDGSEFEPFYNYTRRNYVVIIASDTDGRFLCVRQFRHGINRVTTEFCAGGIELTDDRELEAAKRELKEETGYESDEWQHLLTVPSNATMADNYAHLFIAKNCRKVSMQQLDDTEFLNVELHTAPEIEELIASGEFCQAIHVLAWYMANYKSLV